jgi:hypothetical protein
LGVDKTTPSRRGRDQIKRYGSVAERTEGEGREEEHYAPRRDDIPFEIDIRDLFSPSCRLQMTCHHREMAIVNTPDDLPGSFVEHELLFFGREVGDETGLGGEDPAVLDADVWHDRED